jgi:hypothetical protein
VRVRLRDPDHDLDVAGNRTVRDHLGRLSVETRDRPVAEGPSGEVVPVELLGGIAR